MLPCYGAAVSEPKTPEGHWHMDQSYFTNPHTRKISKTLQNSRKVSKNTSKFSPKLPEKTLKVSRNS
ncbi:hypothetical protein AAMO2058_001494900 [Amorphochlora amoebiformis]